MMIHIIIAAIAVIIILLALIFFIRINNIRVNSNKAEQFKELNDDLSSAGFAYDYRRDYFYSLRDCWQREAGYCRLYDEGSLLFNMVMDCEPITFAYAGKRWLIELWKGQYGITTGAEIGVYNTTLDDIHSELFTGTFYEPISDNEQLYMSFVLFKNGKKLLQRSDRHWWITAFKLGEFSEKDSLTMNVKIKFPSKAMCKAFVDALIGVGYTRREFSVNYKTVSIKYTVPHSAQPNAQAGVQENSIQLVNRNNCRAYQFATAKYSDTLDKLDFLKSSVPELYNFMLHSLYAKEFFKAFEWIVKLIHKHRNPESPEISCPPEPPCSKLPKPSCPTKPPCSKPTKPSCPTEPPCSKPSKPSCPVKPPCNNQCNCKKTETSADIQENVNSLEIPDLPYDDDVQHDYIETGAENEINMSDNIPEPPQSAQSCNNNQNSFKPRRRGCRRKISGDRVDFLNFSYNGDYNDEDDD